MSAPLLAQLFDLSGRVAVVSGASSGIGRALAGYLAGAGAAVVLVARRAAELDAAAAALREDGAEAATVAADLRDLDAIDTVGQHCLTAFGRADILVNAAGINLRQAVHEISTASWAATLDLNLAAPFFLARALAADMRERSYGRIINIASLQSSRAFPNGLAYGAAKGGLCQLTRAMAEAWSRDGITANAIAPGFFPTALTAPVFDDPQTAAWAARQTAVGRNGELADLAGAVVFLAAPASAYVTGQTLYVDGGFTAK